MLDSFHCKCDKGQPDKPCRIFDGNDELYSNSLLARQITDVLTHDGVSSVSVRDMYMDIVEYVALIDETEKEINLMVDSIDGIKHSAKYVKMSIQIVNAVKKRRRLEGQLTELYRDLGKLVGVGAWIGGGTEEKCKGNLGKKFKVVCPC